MQLSIHFNLAGLKEIQLGFDDLLCIYFLALVLKLVELYLIFCKISCLFC